MCIFFLSFFYIFLLFCRDIIIIIIITHIAKSVEGCTLFRGSGIYFYDFVANLFRITDAIFGN